MKFKNWSKKPYGEIDCRRLEDFERLRSFRFPLDVRAWLVEANGGAPSKKTIFVSEQFGETKIHHVYGFHSGGEQLQLDWINETLQYNMPAYLVAICDDEGGNQVSISVRRDDFGSIWFWDHETGDEYPLAKNFAEFDGILREDIEHESRSANVECILRSDDVKKLEEWISNNNINEVDEFGRSLIENAAIYASNACIKFLHENGARAGKSLQLAKNNLKFFPGHSTTVELLESLYGATFNEPTAGGQS